MIRQRAPLIEGTLHVLLAGLLFSEQLRDGATVVLLALLLWDRLVPDEGEASPVPWAWPIGAFLAVNVLAAALAETPEHAFAALRFYPLGVILYLGTMHVVARGGFSRLGAVLSLVVLGLAGDILWQRSTGTSLFRAHVPMWDRYMGSLMYPSDVSLLPILTPLAFAPWVRRGGLASAAVMIGVGLVAVAIAFSGTRVALATILLAVLALGWISGRGRNGTALLVVALVVSVGAAWLGASTAPKRLFSARTHLAEQRPIQWQAAWTLIREAPVLGHGPHGFRRLCVERHGDAGSIFSRVDLRWAPYPHNLYLEALVGTGAAGLAAFLLLIAFPLWGLRSSGSDPRAVRASAVAIALFALTGLVDMSLVKDWVQLCFWLPLGYAAGLKQPSS